MNKDIGIDLGTASTLIHVRGQGLVLREPSVVALDTSTGKVLSVGEEAYRVLGKTPDRIRAIKPLSDGVISDYDVTAMMIKHFLKKVCKGSFLKPRVCVCVPSGVTEVESRAVIDTCLAAGARKVYLMEEPVAACLGAGIDIRKPGGVIVLDMGGGTSDIAVLSLSGIVCKTSIKVAGNRFNEAIVRYVRDRYNVLLGDNTAERTKIEIGTIWEDDPLKTYEVKGRNLMNGLPHRLELTNKELIAPLLAEAEQVASAVQSVLERTPPELVADIHERGLLMTGGGAMLGGLDKYLSHRMGLKCYLADDPVECVARGVGMAFDYLDELVDGFINHTNHYQP